MVIVAQLDEWFSGHGGLVLGGTSMVVAPLGHAAGGASTWLTRSHLPGLGVGANAGILFRRQWGIVGHIAYAKHLAGTDSPDSPTSSQIGLTGRYLLLPEQRTPYVELGFNKTRLASEVTTERIGTPTACG